MLNESQVSKMMRLLKAVDAAYSKVECPMSHSDLDREQPIHICMSLGDLRDIRFTIQRARGGV